MTKDDIAKIDGFNLDLAQKIVDFCKQKGGIANLDELKQVQGINEALLSNLEKNAVIAQKGNK